MTDEIRFVYADRLRTQAPCQQQGQANEAAKRAIKSRNMHADPMYGGSLNFGKVDGCPSRPSPWKTIVL